MSSAPVHLLSERFHGEDLYFFTPENAAQAQAAIEDYLNEALALAKQDGFNVLGHLTLPLRYFNEMRGLSAAFDPYEEQIRVILKTLIENGRGIELNVNRGNTPLPDAKWLRLYPGIGRRAHHAGNGRPYPRPRRTLYPGAAGPSAGMRL